MPSHPFLYTADEQFEICLLCQNPLGLANGVQIISNDQWEKQREMGKQWKVLHLLESSQYINFLTVHERMEPLPKADNVHVYRRLSNCRISFLTEIGRIRKNAVAATNTESDVAENNASSSSASLTPTRQSTRRVDHDKNALCFVCNLKGENDDAPYNNGGLGRCSQNTAKDMLINAQQIHILEENSDLYPAANRLLIATSGTTV